MQNFKFNRETDKLVATRDFNRGKTSGEKGKDVDIADLDDNAIRHLCTTAGVAKVEKQGGKKKAPAKTKPKAAPVASKPATETGKDGE